MVVTGAIPAATQQETGQLELDTQCCVQEERLFLQTRLALRHLAAVPRTPPGRPDVLFLCGGSVARRLSGQGGQQITSPRNGALRRLVPGTTPLQLAGLKMLERYFRSPESDKSSADSPKTLTIA